MMSRNTAVYRYHGIFEAVYYINASDDRIPRPSEIAGRYGSSHAKTPKTSPNEASQTADRRGVYTFHSLKLWSYWTDVHRMFTPYNQIIVDRPFKIRSSSAILQSVSECQSNE